MSATPYFPFYPGDYLADTMGLSCCEHGTYLLLLAVSWQRGPLPDDMDHLQRLAANPPIEALRYILQEYWTRTDRGWINARMEREREKLVETKARRSAAGKVAVEAREAKRIESISNRSSIDHRIDIAATSNHIHIQKEETPYRSPAAKREKTSPTSPMVAEVLDHLNAKSGGSFKARNNKGEATSSAKLIAARIDEHGKDALIAVVDYKAMQWGSDEKWSQYLRPTTLFGKQKCEEYIGQLGRPARHASSNPAGVAF